MSILCTVVGHVPLSFRHRNQGLEFSLCHHCGCDLIRGDGDWIEVPAGFRVIWRKVAAGGDAASIAGRMHRGKGPPPPRRHPRNAAAPRRRDPRGRPLTGAMTLLGVLGFLTGLMQENEREQNKDRPRARIGRVICLPGAR